VKDAWEQAQKMGAAGRYLEAVMRKAFLVSTRVRTETAIGRAGVSVPHAAVELARKIFGRLEKKNVLLLGAGKMSELIALGLVSHGAQTICIANRTLDHAGELAAKVGGVAVSLEERWIHMVQADLIISSTSCPHAILNREEAERLVRRRMELGYGGEDEPVVIVDIALPRDVDAAVGEIKGIFLYDLDDLEDVLHQDSEERDVAAAAAHKILHSEAQGFRARLTAEKTVPTIVAVRTRLDEICRQELDSFRKQNGPFSHDQDEMLSAMITRMTQRITASLARELRELPEKVEQEQMAIALQRLFHLRCAEQATAGTTSA
jgi:glutamyl-tRNA reductase